MLSTILSFTFRYKKPSSQAIDGELSILSLLDAFTLSFHLPRFLSSSLPLFLYRSFLPWISLWLSFPRSAEIQVVFFSSRLCVPSNSSEFCTVRMQRKKIWAKLLLRTTLNWPISMKIKYIERRRVIPVHVETILSTDGVKWIKVSHMHLILLHFSIFSQCFNMSISNGITNESIVCWKCCFKSTLIRPTHNCMMSVTVWKELKVDDNKLKVHLI